MLIDQHVVWLRTLVAACVSAYFLLLIPASVTAECTSYDAWPSFREVAPTATTVVSGEVVNVRHADTAELALRFDLRIDHVYQGQAPKLLPVEVLRSGLPLTRCPESMLRTHPGDVIALALDGRVGGFEGPVNAVAWISGRPHRFSTPEVERITEDELRTLLELPSSDMATVSNADPSLLSLAAAGSAISALLWFGRHRRTSSAR